MGTKLSTMSKKKKFASSQHSSTKTYNFDQAMAEKDAGSTAGSDSLFTAGRTFHHVSNSAYWFPNDNEEMDRLVGQHFAIKSLFGGNIYKKIVDDLDFDNETRTVLDLGCGPGTWIMDVATEYPSTEFTGVDMCDVFPNNIRPKNVSFHVGNVLEQMPFEDNSFDMVNMRLFIVALKKEEWPIILKEAYRVLKPGGYVQIVECGMMEGGNEFIRTSATLFESVIDERGQDPQIKKNLPSLLAAQNFSLQHFEDKPIPLSKNDALTKEFIWDVCAIFKSAQAVLQEPLGCSPDNYPQFLNRLYKELPKLPEANWSFVMCVGQK